MIPNINLLPKHQRVEDKSKLVWLVLAIITLLVLTVFVWQYFSARFALDDLQAQELALQQQHAQLQAEYAELISVNEGTLEESVAFVERVSYDVTPLIAETQNLLPENTYLTSYLFSDTTLNISIDFETMSDIATYVERLSASPFFLDEQVASVSNFEITGPADETDTTAEEDFNELPRYRTTISLMLDLSYLASFGEVQ